MQDRKRFVLRALALFCLFGGTWSAAQHWFLPEAEQGRRMQMPAVGGFEELAGRPEGKRSVKTRTSGLSDSLLIDSILTIVQNYYVDEARVENKPLMKATIRALDEQDIIRLHVKDDNDWTVIRGEDRLPFQFAGKYTFDELVRDSLRLSRFLEKVDPVVFKNKNIADRSGSHLLLNALLSSLDPHSNLLNPDEYRDLRQGTEGSFGGLGVVVGMQDDVLTVVKPLPKSPAARAGVNKFDRIMQIDDKVTYGTTIDDLIQYMRGEPGTKVRLSLLRDGEAAPRSVFLTREVIQVDSVEWKLIDAPQGKIFYAFVDSFSSRTASELREALLKAQQKKDPIIGIVLDLRSNPGGLLDQAVKMADLFLDEGKILTTQGRTREHDNAKKGVSRFDYPIVVINNGDTASASEIVAGALRDHGRALIVGEPSFGKGSVQTVFELPGDQALKLTIARYYTPSGVSIQNVGITPDIWLQPMIKAKDNMNLMGDYRYKSERFLDHSLDNDKLKNAREDMKAFYTVVPEKSPKDKAKDVPLEFSVRVLTELAKKDGVPYPAERLRSSYWKASAAGLIRKSLADLEKRSTDWLRRDLKVDWNEGKESAAPDKDVMFSVQIPKRVTMKEGSTLEVPWLLKNVGKFPVHRLSAYLSGIQGSLGTNEVLIGKIEPGQVLKGVMKFDLKVDAKDGTVRMRAGLARSGWPVVGKEQNFAIELQETQEPNITLDMYLSNEEGGSQAGILEANERARIKVILKNNSNIVAHNVDLRLVNLAGNQIRVDSNPLSVGQMAPGSSKVVFVPLVASANLVSEEFRFGASVKSTEHVVAKKTHYSLPSIPNARVSKSDMLTGSGPWKEN
jgi:carboxyl-terminal processing protease